MKAGDIRELGEILRRNFAVYSKELTPDMIEVWFDALAHYSLEDIGVALTRHVRDADSGRFAPKPADVIAHLAGGSSVRALRAWSMVDKAVRMVGHYVSVAFDDPIIHRVIDDMGGWTKLAMTATLDDLKYRGLEFQKRYQGALITGGVGQDYPPYLIGAAEAHNALERARVAPPTLIGDAHKCQQVIDASRGAGGLRITNAASAAKLIQGAVKRIGKSDPGNEGR
jgi:hypothetical protein